LRETDLRRWTSDREEFVAAPKDALGSNPIVLTVDGPLWAESVRSNSPLTLI